MHALFALNRDDEALECFDRAIALQPDVADSYWNKSLVKLWRGEFEEGFKLHEWRWKLGRGLPPARAFAQPLWLGETDLTGKTILIHSEQGFGMNQNGLAG